MATSLTFGDSLKIDSNSSHALEVTTLLHTSTLKGSPKASLHLEALCASVAVMVVNRHEASTDWQLYWGHLESLAFRAFDKTIIFQHWLSKKNIEIGISLWGFPFETMRLLYPSKLFSKSKIFFQKMFINGFPKVGFEVFLYV